MCIRDRDSRFFNRGKGFVLMPQNTTLSRFSRKVTYDPETESIQDMIENSFRSVENCPLVDGVLLENIDLAEGDNTIDHKLGRVLRGWVITRQRLLSSIYDKQDENASKDKTLVLNSSTAQTVTVDVWVLSLIHI